ncbi:CDP-glycerol glycerophosphotransferase family protein [Viridibacillus sp. YIM B01967]|uniref:CDP-glycerol glycerophosphotransferase family protein n=2 Tax=Viridibacillus soli TaxID=2798301 RepID=A0ABS1H854_9BACL|nr:CDP-glycerol glycerophosphotransferase family protein [Viridibacillus soli]
MLKELLIHVFLFLNRLVFGFFKLFQQKNKIVFLCDFGDNARFVMRELQGRGFEEIYVLKSGKCKDNFADLGLATGHVLDFRVSHVGAYLKGLYHLATGRKILVDNYFAVLSATPFRDNVECIQLWHAAGAIKKFALQDPSIAFRSPAAVKRFEKVYGRMTKAVVGSDEMEPIFEAAFGMRSEQFLRFGIPRTDFYFNQSEEILVQNEIFRLYPQLTGKKVILYAPTFRDQQLNEQTIPLDFTGIMKSLGEDFALVIKLHPAVAHSIGEISHPAIVSVANDVSISKLLFVTDYLISDYSSIPFEFALLGKPQIFYPYDLEAYELERGFWTDYEQLVPGPVVSNDDELVNILLNHVFEKAQIEAFSAVWNAYSDGHASEKLAEYLMK